MIFLCTPANPTGAKMRKADLLKILDYCKRAGFVAVNDECFIDTEDYVRFIQITD